MNRARKSQHGDGRDGTPGRRRIISRLIAVVFAAALTLVPGTVSAAGGATLHWDDEGTLFKVFGPNQAVTATGQIGFECDAFFPTADIYIVRGIPSGTLTDVTGAKNTVFGATGGFFSDRIAVTQPTGGLGAGLYTVVYDECQDGDVDPIDSVFVDAFRVVMPAEIPPVDSALRASKDAAGEMQIRATAALAHFERSLWLAGNYQKLLSCFSGDRGECVALAQSELGLDPFKPPAPLEMIRLQAKDVFQDNVMHWKGLADDPPDGAFMTPTILSPVSASVGETDDSLIDAQVTAVNALRVEAALTQALVSALERYQGADAAGNGDWALAHARGAADFARLLADHLAASSQALAALKTAFADDARDFDNAAARISAEFLRMTSQPLTAAERADLARINITETAFLRAVAGLADLHVEEFDEAAFATALGERIQAAFLATNALQELAADLSVIADGIASDPRLANVLPTVDAGGPYSATEGTNITFAGTASDPDGTIVDVRWDLNGDGVFENLSGLVHIDQPRAPIVGVQVRDDDGNVAVDYAPATMIVTRRPPRILSTSPAADTIVRLQVGADGTAGPATFSVAADRENGGSLFVQWLLDGQEVATGDSFAYVNAGPKLGIRHLEARVSNGKAVRRTWHVITEAPDEDGDGWNAHAPGAWDPPQAPYDCADDDPGRNPAEAEVRGNGVDDDCNGATLDRGEALETIVVPVDGSTATSATTLIAGKTYTLRAAGEVFVGGPGFGDAEFVYNRSRDVVFDNCFDNPDDVDIGIGINSAVPRLRKSPDWGPFNERHEYRVDFVGEGRRIEVNYNDCQYGDNSSPTPGRHQLRLSIIDPLGALPEPTDPPELEAIADQVMHEGATVLVPVAARHAGGDPVTLSVEGLPSFADFADAGDGTGAITLAPVDGGYAEVTVSACTSGGCVVRLFSITVINRSPVLEVGNNGPVGSGEPAEISATADDPGADAIEYAFDCEGDGTFSAFASAASTTCSFGIIGAHVVLVQARDGDGGTANASTIVVVANAAPMIAPLVPVVVDEGSTVDVEVDAADADDSLVFLTAEGLPAYATLTDEGGGDGTITLSPTDDDQATIEMSACDLSSCGSAVLEVTARNVAPSATASNDGPVNTRTSASISVAAADPGADTFEYAFDCDGPGGGAPGPFGASSTGSCTFAAPGLHEVAVQVRDDDGGVGSASTTVEVVAGNRPPVAADLALSTPEDTPLAMTLPASDADGDALTIAFEQPRHGSFDGTTYTPAANYHGPDSFAYSATDPGGESDGGFISITVTSVNDSPTAADDTAETNAGIPLVLAASALLGNDSDPDGDTLTVTSAGPAAHGEVALAASGVTYTPADGYSGSDAFSYTIADGNGGTDTATVTVRVHSLERPPLALVLDDGSIDNGSAPNFFSAAAVNDRIARVGLRASLPAFAGANVGRTYVLHSGQVGSEGWFALKTIPSSWVAAGPTADGLQNYFRAGPGLGSGRDAERLLEKVPDVTPLRAAGLKQLVGERVCAVVYDSGVSINYGPLVGNVQGANLGVVAFEVRSVTTLSGYASSALPKVEIEVVDKEAACGGRLRILTDAPAPTSSSVPFDTVP